jgi:hypothetical protein
MLLKLKSRGNDMNKIPDDEIFRALAARIVLADRHLLAATLIISSMKRVLPAPAAHNVDAARGGLESALKREALLAQDIEELAELGAAVAEVDAA